jgi:hypothetical protein
MLDNRRLVLDSFCEVYDLLRPWADQVFWDWEQIENKIVPGSIYLVSRKEFGKHSESIKALADTGTVTIFLSNPHEGSWTMIGQCHQFKIYEQVQKKQIWLISGGDMDSSYECLTYDSFLPKLLDYEENKKAQADYAAKWSTNRPYKFLFLNGRGRPHRKDLLKRLDPLLPEAIWTNLDSAAGPVQVLPAEYEFDFYKKNSNLESDQGYVKYELFNNDWGEIYLYDKPYLDTHFSLVTETVFDYPYSFRTEKIWKPVCIGHPFIAVANQGFYKDFQNLGFKTFGNLIDESFDTLDNNDQRLERIAQEVEWLCKQDLAKFTEEAYNVCKYNQEHLAEMSVRVRQEFPERFRKFINERS